jgi:hypothetical protein
LASFDVFIFNTPFRYKAVAARVAATAGSLSAITKPVSSGKYWAGCRWASATFICNRRTMTQNNPLNLKMSLQRFSVSGRSLSIFIPLSTRLSFR